MRTRRWKTALAPWLVLALGCAGGAEPVAQLTVKPAQLELRYPGFSTLELEWSIERPLEGLTGEVRVFVHLLDELGELTRTFDHPLPVGWTPGSTESYGVKIYQSALAPPLSAGTYDLAVGLYDGAGKRFPVQTAGDEVADMSYRAARVSVTESAGDFPMFFFSPTWQPVEGGTDRQVLGRRWLGESGSIRVSELSRPGTLWLGVGIPAGQGKSEELVLREGASVPAVEIRSSCGGAGGVLEGGGSHGLAIDIGLDAEGSLPQECEIGFEANFYLVSLETLARKTVALENLAWSAGG